MRTEAAILVETDRPLVMAELEIPPLRAGQVLVSIAYSGACGTQVAEWRGRKGEDKYLPHCLGHEGSGVVLETGPGVSKVKVDDQVVLSWIRGTGIEAGGAKYGWQDKTVNAGGVTTFQRHAVVSENRLTRLPENLPLDVAVLLGCAAPTGMGAVFNVTAVRPGESVAVFGTGGIGVNACMAASLTGGMPVIGIDPSATRRALALRFGATHVIDPAAGDVGAAVRAIVPGGVDVAIEASGIPEVMAEALRVVRAQGGRAVVIGNARHGAQLTLDPSLFNQGKSLHGTWGGDSVPDRDYVRFARLLGSGRFDPHELLSAPYPLESASQALEDLEAGRIGRPLIAMTA
jgi:S-(hydroxymethyl)glutathione dehydrogenase/alcohol dehydrogenase